MVLKCLTLSTMNTHPLRDHMKNYGNIHMLKSLREKTYVKYVNTNKYAVYYIYTSTSAKCPECAQSTTVQNYKNPDSWLHVHLHVHICTNTHTSVHWYSSWINTRQIYERRGHIQ